METSPTQRDPYKYSRALSWPVVHYNAPFLMSVPGELAEASQSFSMRLPVDLMCTIDAHCRTMGVSKSEWIRNALRYLLSGEQHWLDGQSGLR